MIGQPFAAHSEVRVGIIGLGNRLLSDLVGGPPGTVAMPGPPQPSVLQANA